MILIPFNKSGKFDLQSGISMLSTSSKEGKGSFVWILKAVKVHIGGEICLPEG